MAPVAPSAGSVARCAPRALARTPGPRAQCKKTLANQWQNEGEKKRGEAHTAPQKRHTFFGRTPHASQRKSGKNTNATLYRHGLAVNASGSIPEYQGSQRLLEASQEHLGAIFERRSAGATARRGRVLISQENEVQGATVARQFTREPKKV